MAKNIRFFLEKEGFRVDVAHDGHEAKERFERGAYDLVLLDWTLPGIDGLELCRMFRRTSDVPIMMITAKEELVDKVVGLEVGADDYLTKPFHQRELLARMKALLRRSALHRREDGEHVHSWRGLILDKNKLTLSYDGRSIPLTATEFKLLDCFMQRPEQVFTREFLFETVWGTAEGYSDRTVDVNVSRLRKKIAELSGIPVLHAVRGMGYRFGE